MSSTAGPVQGEGRRVYARLLRHVMPHWRRFALGLAAMVVLGATEPALAAILKPTFDGSFVDKDVGTVALMAMLLVVLFGVRGLCTYASALAMASVSSQVVMDLRRQMFAKLMELPNEAFDATSSGALVSKITYDASQVTEAATQVITVLVRDTVLVAGLLGVMLYHNWKLTLIGLVAAPLVVLVVKHFTHRLRRVSFELQRLMGLATHVVQETLEGQKVVRSFGAQDHVRGRFASTANRLRQFEVKFASAASIISPIAQLVTACGLAVMLYMAARESAADAMTVGTFASFFAAMGLLFAPLKRLTSVNARLQRGIAAATSVFALVDQPSEPDTGTRTLGRARGEVRFEGVSFRYPGAREPALRGVDLAIDPGERLALVGPSGSGKTTLAHLLSRFYHPQHGRVLVDGIDVSAITLRSLREQIALVSQEVVLFEGSVRENIAYGPLAERGEEALWRAVDAGSAREFIERLPQGIDTQVGENAVRLSGGQRQRLAIARAFLKDAPILILDEATSSLDNRSERAIQQALRELSRGRTTLVIAHRLSSIEDADRIVVMEHGRILDSGTHAELLERSTLYASLYRFQSGRAADDSASAQAR